MYLRLLAAAIRDCSEALAGASDGTTAVQLSNASPLLLMRLESLQSRGLSEDCPTKSNKIGKSISRKFVQIILIPAFQSQRPASKLG